MPSCVLAYSGGLDTSVILGWLQEEGYEVHAVYVDLGQPCEDRQAILNKAKTCGAASARIVDAQEELCRDFAFPVMQWQAKYEGVYLLGTSIARPLISKMCLQVAHEVGATVYAHGATGKGNDQLRFQLAAELLEPSIRLIAGRRLSALGVVKELNTLGGRNGIGQIDLVENRFVGMKSRGVYEAPGMTILYFAHRVVEQLTLDRDLVHLRDRLAPEVAEMVYYGFWFAAKMDALLAFSLNAQRS